MIIARKPGETDEEWLERIRRIQEASGDPATPPSWPVPEEWDEEEDEDDVET